MYKCPYQTRIVPNEFLLCKKLIKDGVNYHDITNGIKAMCAHQYICSVTRQAENTDGAKQCFTYNSSFAKED